MKILIKAVSTVALFSFGGFAIAEQCPDNLNANDTYDCIVVDGADNTFEAINTRKDEQAKGESDSKADHAMADGNQTHAGL